MEASNQENLAPEGSDRKDGDIKKVAEGENEFAIGDYVWVYHKRTNLWWPGQISDPSKVSEFANKSIVKGYYLVVFIHSFSSLCCQHSKLKRFAENYSELSKQSDRKDFLMAVEEALEDFKMNMKEVLRSLVDAKLRGCALTEIPEPRVMQAFEDVEIEGLEDMIASESELIDDEESEDILLLGVDGSGTKRKRKMKDVKEEDETDGKQVKKVKKGDDEFASGD